MKVATALIASSLALAAAQQIGQYTAEEHPPFPTQVCTKAGGCKTEKTSLVMDAAWRWVHKVNDYTACMDNGVWNATYCPDPTTCAQNCALEGITVADYGNNYGVTVSGDEVTMKYSEKFGSRMYLMAEGDTKYKLFKLLNQELSFDIDGNLLECGMNGALYLVSMNEDGDSAKYPTNKAGAKYGTGYCDAQCPTNNFQNGKANFGAKTSQGKYGLCCAEYDIWEGNKAATVFTSHPSSKDVTTFECNNDVDCGFGGDNFYKSIVDKGGCGFNAYSNGNHQYYGAGSGFAVDSSKKITVVTQFITDDKTANGKLVEIRRLYKQDGKVIANYKTSAGFDSVTDAYCKASTSGTDYHLQHGGLAGMGRDLGRGMVLAFAVWADSSSQHMQWLDGGNNGPCPADGGDPAVLQKMNIAMKLSNIRVGDIDSTYGPVTPTTAPPTSTPTSSPTPTPTPTTTSTTAPTPTPTPTKDGVARWGQCGGNGYTGSTVCKEGTCTKLNDWYSQCV